MTELVHASDAPFESFCGLPGASEDGFLSMVNPEFLRATGGNLDAITCPKCRVFMESLEDARQGRGTTLAD